MFDLPHTLIAISDRYHFDHSHNLGFFLEKLDRHPRTGQLTFQGHDDFLYLTSVNPTMTTRILRPFQFFRLMTYQIYDVSYALLEIVWAQIKPIFMGPRFNFGMPEDPALLDCDDFIKPPFDMNFNKESFFWYDFLNDPRSRTYAVDKFGKGPGARFPDSMDRVDIRTFFWKIFSISNPYEVYKKALARYSIDRLNSNDLSFSFYIKPYQNMTFLPDCVERFLYLTLWTRNKYYNHLFWHEIFTYIAGTGRIYEVFGNFKFQMEFLFLAFNPFGNVVTAILWRMYSPWIEKMLQFVPKVANIPMYYQAFFIFLNIIIKYLYHTISVMPYVASQGVLEERLIGGKTREVLVFEGVPDAWKQIQLIKVPNGIERIEYLSIPNVLRTYWYEERRDLFKYMLSFFDNSNILPDQVPGSTVHIPPLSYTFTNIIVNLQRLIEMLQDYIS